MSRVPQEKVDRLRSALDTHVPGWTVVYKADQDVWPVWWLRVAKWILDHIVAPLIPSLRDSLYHDFSQGLGGKYILLTSEADDGDWQDWDTYRTIRHEYVHLRDQRRWGFLWYLTYVIPPAILTLRSYWEIRGYTQNMMVEYERTGEIRDETIETIVTLFTSRAYLFMCPWSSWIRWRLNQIRDRIKSREITGLYP
jgi:hypothetical protein